MKITKRVPPLGLLAALVAAGTAVIWIGNHLGLWWTAALVGAVLGVVLRGRLRLFGAAALAALAGWGLDLAWQSTQVDVGGVAGVVALIMGLPRSGGAVVIVAAQVYGLLLALAGAWAGAALRRAALTFIARAAPVDKAPSAPAAPATGE